MKSPLGFSEKDYQDDLHLASTAKACVIQRDKVSESTKM
jgi:hypothetical protein